MKKLWTGEYAFQFSAERAIYHELGSDIECEQDEFFPNRWEYKPQSECMTTDSYKEFFGRQI